MAVFPTRPGLSDITSTSLHYPSDFLHVTGVLPVLIALFYCTIADTHLSF